MPDAKHTPKEDQHPSGKRSPESARWFQAEGLAPPNWQPRFQDHLYVAYTNVVAFSPTDAMPPTRRVKGLMAIQSLISLAVLVVVISRVINILPS